jgi:hypothetical protein
MKKIHKLLVFASVIIGMMQLTSCKKDAVIAETEEDIFMNKITGSWNVSTVMLDGKDVSKSFPGLKIAIAATKQVTVTNAVPPIWNGTGTFTLEPAGGTFQLKRNDGVVMTVVQNGTDKLTLEFLYDADALGGRVNSVTGKFVFQLLKP